MKYTPTVFLVDDDTDDQEIFSIAMQEANDSATCVFANDGMEAIEKIKSDENFTPDFIFLDLNMPRMNGQQCLEEIKKISRLSHVPVYMYSTSADPMTVDTHKKMGALDFIVKPSDIRILSGILSKIVKQKVITAFFCLLCLSMIPRKLTAQTDTAVTDLKKLTVDQLLDIVVTSVSKSPENLSEVASAIQVISGADIKRAPVTRLPEALRLAGNLQVGQSGSHDWGISSRGFKGAPARSTSLSNKLLVIIDGRTVYTPLFGGVFWDVQNTMMEDLDRIEVISGPGGSIWGANAVNGIINVISKSAKETQGIHAAASAGTLQRDYGALRYGSHIDTTFYFRVYGERYDYNSTKLPNNVDADDEWSMTNGGFRMDYLPNAKSTVTLQGDLYEGNEDASPSTTINGQNILARWTYDFSDKSQLTVQSYIDRTYRNIKVQGLTDELTTYDLDVHHSYTVGTRNKIVWGGGYRAANDATKSIVDNFDPDTRTLQLFNVFVQDQYSIIPEKLDLTVGSKFLYNDYTEFEIQPGIRLAYTPNVKNTLWSAVSRAVRTPTRYDADYNNPVLGSDGDFKSEEVVAYELGYRLRPLENVSVSIATFYNQYTNLRSIDLNTVPIPSYYFANNLEANTYGVEISAIVAATPWWKLRGGYTFINESFTNTSAATYFQTYLFEAADAKNHLIIHSMIDLPRNFQFDMVARYVDVVSKQLGGKAVPAYATFDVRLAYNYKWLTASISGLNLAEKYHVERGIREIPTRISGKITIDL